MKWILWDLLLFWETWDVIHSWKVDLNCDDINNFCDITLNKFFAPRVDFHRRVISASVNVRKMEL